MQSSAVPAQTHPSVHKLNMLECYQKLSFLDLRDDDLSKMKNSYKITSRKNAATAVTKSEHWSSVSEMYSAANNEYLLNFEVEVR